MPEDDAGASKHVAVLYGIELSGGLHVHEADRELRFDMFPKERRLITEYVLL